MITMTYVQIMKYEQEWWHVKSTKHGLTYLKMEVPRANIMSY